MSQVPGESVLRWAAFAAGAGAKVVDADALNWGSTTWLLRVQHAGAAREVVLRIAGGLLPEHIATGSAALVAAAEHGVAAPHLIAADLDGSVAGLPARLETFLPGSSDSPSRASSERLRATEAAIAKVHSVQLQPRPHLPRRIRSSEFSDRPRQR
jgi:hypothetical protein